MIIMSCSFLLSCTKEIAEDELDEIFNDTVDVPLLSSNFTSELIFKFMYNHSKPNEGFAVYENYAFGMYATGICDVYDLNERQYFNSFHLGSYSFSNHANVADFGIEFPAGNPKFPAIYISECTGSIKDALSKASLQQDLN